MTVEELKEIKQLAMNYGDPIRGKILACVSRIEVLEDALGSILECSTDVQTRDIAILALHLNK